MTIFRRIKIILRSLVVILLLLLLVTRSDLAPANEEEEVRAFTRNIEFDYISWTLHAMWLKISQEALGANRYLTPTAQHNLVYRYLDLIKQQSETENQISDIYANPESHQPEILTASLSTNLQAVQDTIRWIGPIAESILQGQVSEVLASDGLDAGGETLPPVLYHATPLPMALIISPRNIIRADVDVSLIPDLSLDQIVHLEDAVSARLNVSALVVPVGGIGIYPTMVMQTTDLNWLSTTISHEWTHNYLTLRPLGLSYDASPQLRTMNETTASISGGEVGSAVIDRFYPELAQPEITSGENPAPKSSAPPAFDFRAEMHATRVKVDAMLAAGEIDQAEAYMNAQRKVFYAHGYPIRKLNQAYFAFYGAYADQPGGAAGADPVGPAVRTLRKESPTLADFINRISWMTSFAQLKNAVR